MTADASAGRLGRDALIYALGFVAQRAAGFIMLPVYTRYLSPAHYATLHLVQMSLDVTAILLAAGVTAGVYRFYFKGDEPEHRKGVMTAAWGLMTLFNLVGAGLLAWFAPEIASTVLEDPAATELVYIGAVNFALDPSLVVPMLLMQVQQRSGLYTATSMTRLVIQLGLNVLFVVVLGAGVRGILIATLLAYVALNGPLLWWFFRQVGWTWRRAALKDLLLFGLPYRLTESGSFILTYADRFFLQGLHGLAVTGVYSLAYQFGFVLGYLGAMPFFMAWNPQRFQLVDRPKAERDRSYDDGFTLLSLVVVTLAVGISLFVEPTLGIMSDADYHGAARLVPVILSAYVFQAWTQAMEFGIQVSERTRYATYGTGIAVAVILTLYALLIPPYGAWGAAIATSVAFATRLVAYIYYAQRLFPVAYRWGAPLRMFGVGVAVVAGYFALGPSSLWSQLGWATVGTLIYGGVVWFAALDASHRAVAVSVVNKGRALVGRLRGG